MPFNLLIDYDNVETNDQTRGLVYIIQAILFKLSPSEVNDRNATVRFYGGWYENAVITRKAQDLLIEISNNFPITAILSDSSTQVIVNAELAMSLNVAPRSPLFNTYRQRGVPSGLKSIDPTTLNCYITSCPIIHVHDFIRSGICSRCSRIKVEHILYRPEQKLVDTMLTSDLITIAQTERKVCIVSSDDDFWPGILTSVSSGNIVYHFHTKNGRITPQHYRRLANQNYHMKSL